jgi:NADPH-dependent 7-cyano-7-deazaguanine reductase QueF
MNIIHGSFVSLNQSIMNGCVQYELICFRMRGTFHGFCMNSMKQLEIKRLMQQAIFSLSMRFIVGKEIKIKPNAAYKSQMM